MDRLFIESLIRKHEGNKLHVYQDSEGIDTIGVGFNLESTDAQKICTLFGLNLINIRSGYDTLTQDQVDEIFTYQLNQVIKQSMNMFQTFSTMPDKVQAVVCDLIFNMGIGKFREFHNTIASLKLGDWKAAASHLHDSKWFHQVGTRATDNIAILEAA